MLTRQIAITDLDNYAKMTLSHSERQYSAHGTLHDVALDGFSQANIWSKPWLPYDFDIGQTKDHSIYRHVFSEEQKLAWNHLQWGLEYTVVGQGERQIITLNNYAVSQYKHILPSVVELETRECFEEVDHLAAFQVGLDALKERYFPSRMKALWSIPASGFSNEFANEKSRKWLGKIANHLLGSNFPTLFFLTRGMKTHNFKPFENGIANNPDTPEGIRRVSHLHRLDESRHMATALYIAKLSNVILDTVPSDNRLLFKMAIRAAWPKHRMFNYRLRYWASAIQSPVFNDISLKNKHALLAHIKTHTFHNLLKLHHRQTRLTRQANKRIVEECGLSSELKKLFVETLRKEPSHAPLVDAVSLD